MARNTSNSEYLTFQPRAIMESTNFRGKFPFRNVLVKSHGDGGCSRYLGLAVIVPEALRCGGGGGWRVRVGSERNTRKAATTTTTTVAVAK